MIRAALLLDPRGSAATTLGGRRCITEVRMHEAGMVDRVLEVVLARAGEAGATRVTLIRLEAGPLSGVSEDALRFHWAEHAAGTMAEGAELVVTPTEDLIELRLVSFEVEDGADEQAGEAAGAGATDDGRST